MKERYLIIDGYNMIGQSSALSAIAKESLEEAREQLLDAIANYNALIADEMCVYLMHMNNPELKENTYTMALERCLLKRKKQQIVLSNVMYMSYMINIQRISPLLRVI